jgi:drug/metabolite transporter (DMT)-like permease
LSTPALSLPNASARGLAGIGFVIAALACFAALDTTTKYVGTSVPVLMALWFRYLFQALSATAMVMPQHGWAAFRTAHPRFQLLRGLLVLLCSVLAYLSLRHLPVSEYTAVVMITPLVITLLAITSLGERVSALRWALVCGGFVGVMFIVRPSGGDFNWGLLLPLCLVAANAWFQVLTSKLARLESPMTMQLCSGWVGVAVTSVALPFVWISLGDWRLWALLVLLGLLSTVGHFLFIQAYARAPAAALTPYLYTQIGFAMLCGWLVFSHVPDGWSFAGIALIAGCGALSAWLSTRESRMAPEPVES